MQVHKFNFFSRLKRNFQSHRTWKLLTEDLIQTIPHISYIPLIEVLRLIGRVASAGFESSINEVVEAPHLLVVFQDGDVVLEWVWYPLAPEAHV